MSLAYIDDTDTAAVTYSGVWQSVSDLTIQGFYKGTIHVANSTTDSNATLIFTGIAARVFGIVSGQTSNQSFTIDGGNTTSQNVSRDLLLSNDLVLYSTPTLPYGQHNLTISARNLSIDYFLVTAYDNTSSSTTFGGSVSSSSIQPSTTNATTTRKSAHQKSIIGAVVALAIVAIFSAVCLWLRYRRKNLDNESDSSSWRFATTIDRHVAWPVTCIPVLPENLPQVVVQPLSPPPSYAMSEPPPYDAGDAGHWASAPVVHSRQLRSSVRLKRRGSQVL